ncbi:AAA family ATPase [Streptomyces sp. NPDC055107]
MLPDEAKPAQHPALVGDMATGDARYAEEDTADPDDEDAPDGFDIHVLPVAPVLGYQDADTAGEGDRLVTVLSRLGGRPVPPLPSSDAAAPADGRTSAGVLSASAPAAGGDRLLRSLTDADEALARWAGQHGDRAERSSVLLWIGHGVRGSAGPALLVPGAPGRLEDARVTPDMFTYFLHSEQRARRPDQGHWAMVVIEACKSEDFVRRATRPFHDGLPEPPSLLVVATGRTASPAYLGTFGDSLERYLAVRTCRDEVFSLRDLQEHLDGDDIHSALFGRQAARELRLRLRDRVPLAGAVTVAEERRLQREFDGAALVPADGPETVAPDLETTDGQKAPVSGRPVTDTSVPAERGDGELSVTGAPGFLEVVPGFTGRAADLARVADWCADTAGPSVLVVTGAPGAGKSALLGEVLGRMRDAGPDAFGGARVGAVLRLTGATRADVRDQLAQALGAEGAESPESGAESTGVSVDPGATPAASERDGPAQSLRDRLASWAAAAAPAPVLILADALDEARDPVQVATFLRELTADSGVRLLIGTRVSPYDDGDAGGLRVDLRTVLGTGTGHAREWELGADASAAGRFAAEAVRRVLGERPALAGDDPGWPLDVERVVRESVEANVRSGEWRFLQVALTVRELEERQALLGPDPQARADLAALLARDRTGLFGAAVARITERLPGAEAFLHALANGQGRGLPRADGIWATAAAGIAGDGSRPGNQELSLFLSRAAAYVLLDGEDRRSVYRLAHRTYAEQLQASGTETRLRGMLVALLELAAEQCAAGQPLSPHLEARLAQYAADRGAPGWAELAARPSVLDRLPVAALSALALAPGGPGRDGATAAGLPVEVVGTVASAHLIRTALPADRPGLRQLGGLRATGRPHPAGEGAAWAVRWGRVRKAPPHLRLGGADGALSALAASPGADWLVTGGLDGTVEVWRPWLSHRPALLLRGRDRPVIALAAHLGNGGAPANGSGSPTGAVRPDIPENCAGSTAPPASAGPESGDGPGTLLAVHDDRTLQLWAPGGGAQGPLTVRTAEVARVAAALTDGTERFAVGGEGGYLALVGPSGALRAVRTPSAQEVVGLAPLPGPDGRQWLAAAHRSGDVVLWDVTGPGDPKARCTLPTRMVLTGLAALTGADGSALLATTGEKGAVRLWEADPNGDRVVLRAAAGRPGLDDAPSSVPAVLPGPDGDALAVGDERGTLRTLAPDGSPARVVCPGGVPPVRSVAALRGPGGGHILATVSFRDSHVRFWAPDPEPGEEEGPSGPELAVTGLSRRTAADGTEFLVVTGTDATGNSAVRMLRASDGEEARADTATAATADGPAPGPPAEVAAEHGHRVKGWTALAGARAEGLWAGFGRDGVLTWWRAEAGHWLRTHRVDLGSSGRALLALSDGGLAAATDDGIVVLDTDPGAVVPALTGATGTFQPTKEDADA